MFAAILITLGGFIACVDGEDTPTTTTGDDEVGDDTGEGPPPDVCKASCQECQDISKDAYACMAFDEFEKPVDTFSCIVCDGDGSGSAALTCETQANLQSVIYATMNTQLVACAGMMKAECAGWSPARHVHQTGDSEWEIERDVIDALVADPSQLVACDDARVQFVDGRYQVLSVGSDDLLGELGLTDGDVIESVNRHALKGPFDVARAFFSLWPDTQAFDVSVLRPGVGALTLTYHVVQ